MAALWPPGLVGIRPGAPALCGRAVSMGVPLGLEPSPSLLLPVGAGGFPESGRSWTRLRGARPGPPPSPEAPAVSLPLLRLERESSPWLGRSPPRVAVHPDLAGILGGQAGVVRSEWGPCCEELGRMGWGRGASQLTIACPSHPQAGLGAPRVCAPLEQGVFTREDFLATV